MIVDLQIEVAEHTRVAAVRVIIGACLGSVHLYALWQILMKFIKENCIVIYD